MRANSQTEGDRLMRVENIVKSYNGKTILNGFSFDFPEGKITAVTGKSGCGKTTLLRIISGLEKADGGTVIGAEGRKSFVFQENRLIENVSVEENILCVAPDTEKSEYYLKRTGLYEVRKMKAGKLSGGMKRRLSLARCLSFGGDIFILDEPLRELDEETLLEMMKLLKEAVAGKTVIMSVHDEEQIKYLADCICSLT